jgi:DNA repair exonuclease SbcCD nuclease subunit
MASMSRVLLFSDIHIFPHKRKNERLEDCLKVLKWVFKVAEEEEIQNILFGGDFFHDRQKIEIYTYQKTFEILQENLKDSNFNLFLLLGNHDIWFNDNTNVSSVFPLSALPGVKVISKPERLKIENSYWDFIPFTHNPLASLEELKKKEGKSEYALGHLAIDGALLHHNQYADVCVEHDGDMVPINSSLFNHYKHTFLGHYHAEQRVSKKVEYIGSPLQLSFGEAFQKKHIIIFDCAENEKTYIENEFSPKHLVIDAKDCENYQLEGNFVQIKVEDISGTDLISFKKDISQKNKFGSLEIKQQKKIIEEHTIKDAKAILSKGDEMLKKYVKEVGANDLDEDILVKIGQKICQKVDK